MNLSKHVRVLIVLYAILQSSLNYWIPLYPDAFPGGICQSLSQGRALVTENHRDLCVSYYSSLSDWEEGLALGTSLYYLDVVISLFPQ